MSAIDRAALIRALPYARRYARALTGTQVAAATRWWRMRCGRCVTRGMPGRRPAARASLYGAIGDAVRAADDRAAMPDSAGHVAAAAHAAAADGAGGAAADRRRRRLPASIPAEAEHELRIARDGLRTGITARVLIIEDEPIIALDIQELVERCGHSVVGIAATEAEAVAIAGAERPGLVLADINLGAGGDGASAVARILRDLTAPVIFVTAYPERLLTGEAVEPAFIITKPFDPTTLAVATYQAVTRGVRPV